MTLVLGASGLLILPRGCSLRLALLRPAPIVTAGLLVLVLFWGPVAIVGHSHNFAGQRYWWLRDDAMVSMRYADNLAHGLGLVWNPGQHVEGYSNFLWTAYMAAVHKLPVGRSRMPLVVLLSNLVIAAMCLPLIVHLVRDLGGGRLAAGTASASYVLGRSAMRWTTDGFETALMTLLILLILHRMLRRGGRSRPDPAVPFLIATLALVRADAIILAAILYALAFWMSNSWRTSLQYVGASLIVPGLYEVFRVLYYGDLLPNTAYLKIAGWDSRSAAGTAYVLAFCSQHVLLLVTTVIGTVSSRDTRQRALIAGVLAYLIYVAYAGGDAFPDYRFLVPVIPLISVLAMLSIERWQVPQALRVGVALVCLLSVPLITQDFGRSLTPRQQDIGNVAIGLLLRQNALPTSTVADFYAGSALYFSRLRGADLLGKCDPHIARMAVVSAGSKPGHNKFDFDYSIGHLRPDFVIATWRLPVEASDMRAKSHGDYAFAGQLFFHPLFRKHCLPNPVPVDTWRTIFVCDWSPEMPRIRSWRGLGHPDDGTGNQGPFSGAETVPTGAEAHDDLLQAARGPREITGAAPEGGPRAWGEPLSLLLMRNGLRRR